MSASFSGSFDIGHGAFTAPVRPLLTPAAAPKRLGVAPSAVPSPRRATGVVAFVDIMLHGSARRSQAGERARRLAADFFASGPPTTRGIFTNYY